MNNFKIAAIVVGSVLVLGGLFYFGRPTGINPGNLQGSANNSLTPQLLTAEETAYDFGSIRMADGIVRRTFSVKNAGTEPITIERLYTSCMCTAATFKRGGEATGPFGMPGHGFVPKLNKTLAGGETAEIEVEFDPNAHGPAGVGRIERNVYLESETSQPLILEIAATVTP